PDLTSRSRRTPETIAPEMLRWRAPGTWTAVSWNDTELPATFAEPTKTGVPLSRWTATCAVLSLAGQHNTSMLVYSEPSDSARPATSPAIVGVVRIRARAVRSIASANLRPSQ